MPLSSRLQVSSQGSMLQEYVWKLFRKSKLRVLERFVGSCVAGLCLSEDFCSPGSCQGPHMWTTGGLTLKSQFSGCWGSRTVHIHHLDTTLRMMKVYWTLNEVWLVGDTEWTPELTYDVGLFLRQAFYKENLNQVTTRKPGAGSKGRATFHHYD